MKIAQNSSSNIYDPNFSLYGFVRMYVRCMFVYIYMNVYVRMYVHMYKYVIWMDGWMYVCCVMCNENPNVCMWYCGM